MTFSSFRSATFSGSLTCRHNGKAGAIARQITCSLPVLLEVKSRSKDYVNLLLVSEDQAHPRRVDKGSSSRFTSPAPNGIPRGTTRSIRCRERIGVVASLVEGGTCVQDRAFATIAFDYNSDRFITVDGCAYPPCARMSSIRVL